MNVTYKGAKVGCLALLVLYVLLGVTLQLTGLWTSTGPGDDEGGGPFAVMGILFFIAYVVIFGVIGIIRGIVSHFRRESVPPRGFPVEPASPPPNSGDGK